MHLQEARAKGERVRHLVAQNLFAKDKKAHHLLVVGINYSSGYESVQHPLSCN